MLQTRNGRESSSNHGWRCDDHRDLVSPRGCRNGAPMGYLSRLPNGVWVLLKEVARHLLRRPVVGVAMVAVRDDGCVLFIRRADLGTWALPGGTLEWGETLRTAVERELREEAGATLESIESVSGIYSRPDRDPRFHAVTIVVRCKVSHAIGGPMNVAEILEARWRQPEEVQGTLALTQGDLLAHALASGPATIE